MFTVAVMIPHWNNVYKLDIKWHILIINKKKRENINLTSHNAWRLKVASWWALRAVLCTVLYGYEADVC